MTLDFATDLLEKLKSMGFQYHLVLLDPNGQEGKNVHIFEHVEIEEFPIFIENLGESMEYMGAEYEDFIKWMEGEMKKEEKRAKKNKGMIDPSI